VDFLVVGVSEGYRNAFLIISFPNYQSLKNPIMNKRIKSNGLKKEPDELSYFGLSLKSYLIDSHPLLANDTAFISACADTAAETYSNAIKDGLPHDRAEELANVELYRELHFSPYNTLVNILWNEFATEIPEDDAREAALLLLPLCEKVLEKYSLPDDFADTPDYDLLYTELTGTIQILLEDGI
jgi:hypothetical protein